MAEESGSGSFNWSINDTDQSQFELLKKWQPKRSEDNITVSNVVFVDLRLRVLLEWLVQI